MSKHRKGSTPAQPWQPFQQCELSEYQTQLITDDGWAPETYTVWRNNRYQVIKRICKVPEAALAFAGEIVIHLSIKRLDRNPVRDWRHLQRIKNELVGLECEGSELYPAESRLIDEANQYHIYVLQDPTLRFPWGGTERLVGGPEESMYGSKQRPFEE